MKRGAALVRRGRPVARRARVARAIPASGPDGASHRAVALEWPGPACRWVAGETSQPHRADRCAGASRPRAQPTAVAELMDLPEVPEQFPRYNVAPTQTIAAAVDAGGGRALSPMRWGITPA